MRCKMFLRNYKHPHRWCVQRTDGDANSNSIHRSLQKTTRGYRQSQTRVHGQDTERSISQIHDRKSSSSGQSREPFKSYPLDVTDVEVDIAISSRSVASRLVHNFIWPYQTWYHIHGLGRPSRRGRVQTHRP